MRRQRSSPRHVNADKPESAFNLVVQLGVATEDLNRRWYEANTGQVITDIQQNIRHPILGWMGGDSRWARAGQ